MANVQLLSAEERLRVKSLHRSEDQGDFVASHSASRILLSFLSRKSPEELRISQRCSNCGAAHGKPVVDNAPFFVSWSHSRGVVASVASRRPAAIDIERSTRSFLRRPGWLSDGEDRQLASVAPTAACYQIWTRKEALIKLGLASLSSLRSIDTSMVPLPTDDEYFVAYQFHIASQLFSGIDWRLRSTGITGSIMVQSWPDLRPKYDLFMP